MYFTLRAPFNAHSFPPPSHDACVQSLGVMYVFCINDGASFLPKGSNELLQYWNNSQASSRKCGRSRVQKKLLHINYQEGGFLNPYFHLMLIEGSYVFQPMQGFGLKRICSYVWIHFSVLF